MTYLDWNSATNRLQRRQRDDMLDGVDSQASSSKPTVRSDGSAPQTGDRWLSTSDRLWFYWNGTYWLSEQVFSGSVSADMIALDTKFGVIVPVPNHNLFFVDFQAAAVFTAPVNAGNYWEINFQRLNNANPPVAISIRTTNFILSVASGSLAESYQGSGNFLIDIAATNTKLFQLDWRKLGSPGPISMFQATARYRLAKS